MLACRMRRALRSHGEGVKAEPEHSPPMQGGCEHPGTHTAFTDGAVWAVPQSWGQQELGVCMG